MPLSLMLWALFVVPLWALCASLPVQLGLPGGAVALGVLAATALAFAADRRFGAPGPPRHLWPERARWLAFALLAGLGITILASDLGNIGAHMSNARIEPPPPPESPWLAALDGAVFHAGLVLVIVGVAERTLLAIHRPWTAIGIAALLGALPSPLYLWPQWALLIGLPAWLFRHTRSLALSLAAYAPTVVLPLVDLAGFGPGIPGFDVVEPDVHLFQPWWFDLLGGVLVALGVGPLLRDFEAIEREVEADPEPER